MENENLNSVSGSSERSSIEKVDKIGEDFIPIEAGLREKTIIKNILKGKAVNIYNPQYWEGFKKNKDETEEDYGHRLLAAKESTVIEIETENGAKCIIPLPEGKMFHPKSKLASFRKIYNCMPAVGVVVETEFDKNGFRRVVI